MKTRLRQTFGNTNRSGYLERKQRRAFPPPTPFAPSADRASSRSTALRLSRRPGDILIIATFAVHNEVELAKHEPDLIYVDSQTASSVAATRFQCKPPPDR